MLASIILIFFEYKKNIFSGRKMAVISGGCGREAGCGEEGGREVNATLSHKTS